MVQTTSTADRIAVEGVLAILSLKSGADMDALAGAFQKSQDIFGNELYDLNQTEARAIGLLADWLEGGHR
jgi:hypothetical protein